MKQHPTESPKLILCTAEPSWNYDKDEKLQGEDNLSTITKIALDAGARIGAVIAGDLHHYSRYHSKDAGTSFITAGGGGAYFSPTHYLQNIRRISWGGKKIDLDLRCQLKDGKSTGRPSCWPSRGESRRLSLWTLGFPFRNYGFAVALGVIYWLIIWVFARTAYQGSEPIYNTVGDVLVRDPKFHYWPDVLLLTPLAAAQNVMLGIMGLALWLVLYSYADSAWGNKVKLAMGTLHWAAHIAMMIVLYFAVTRTSTWLVQLAWPQASAVLEQFEFSTTDKVRELFREIVIFPLEMIFVGGIFAGLVWGAYLTLSCLAGLHCDQAFASMAMANFKNFLRLKIEPNKLTIYPIGLRRAPKRWSWRYAKRGSAAAGSDGPQIVPMRPLRPSLIEGPIEIRVGDVKRSDPPAGGPASV
jgi:hypothetical protein